jgi:tetratricopeptide (TPR) repeat protein
MHPNTATVARNLGALYAREKKYAESEKYYRQAVSILEKVWGADSPNLSSCLEGYIAILRHNEHYADAEQWETRATRIRVKTARAADISSGFR